MRKIGLYTKLCWLFFIALFIPTATLKPKIDAMLAKLKDEESVG